MQAYPLPLGPLVQRLLGKFELTGYCGVILVSIAIRNGGGFLIGHIGRFLLPPEVDPKIRTGG